MNSALTILEQHHLNIKDELFEQWLDNYVNELEIMYRIVLNMLKKFNYSVTLTDEEFYIFIYTNTLNTDYNKKYRLKQKPLKQKHLI